MMRILSEGGLSQDATHPSVSGNNDRRLLAEARREYARKLKERFLGGAARFLLQDQDPKGIEKLEGRLVSELDMALKFSCLVWSRDDPLAFKGLHELDGDGTSSALAGITTGSETDDGNSQQPIIVVLQPAVMVPPNSESPHDSVSSRICVKANVIRESPPPPPPLESPASQASDTSGENLKTPVTAASITDPPSTALHPMSPAAGTLEFLPRIAFKPS